MSLFASPAAGKAGRMLVFTFDKPGNPLVVTIFRSLGQLTPSPPAGHFPRYAGAEKKLNSSPVSGELARRAGGGKPKGDIRNFLI